jgi:hypothetical protein
MCGIKLGEENTEMWLNCKLRTIHQRSTDFTLAITRNRFQAKRQFVNRIKSCDPERSITWNWRQRPGRKSQAM